jgi:hypothetical protein
MDERERRKRSLGAWRMVARSKIARATCARSTQPDQALAQPCLYKCRSLSKAWPRSVVESLEQQVQILHAA